MKIISSSLCTQKYLCFKRALASRFACFLPPLVPISSWRPSKHLHYSEKLTSPFSVMASTRMRLLSILYFSGVLCILKQVDKYRFWTSLKPSTTYFTWSGVSTALSRTIWYYFDRKISDIRQCNTYTALRIHMFDPTLLHLLSFVFLKHPSQ